MRAFTAAAKSPLKKCRIDGDISGHAEVLN
jgi:hypothetical protein